MVNYNNIFNFITIQSRKRTWKHVETFYINSDEQLVNHRDLINQIKVLIKSIRERGFDKTLYAGISLWHLRISKKSFSGMEGLPPKNSLFFDWTDNGIRIEQNGILILQQSKCEYTPEIEAVLQELEKS